MPLGLTQRVDSEGTLPTAWLPRRSDVNQGDWAACSGLAGLLPPRLLRGGICFFSYTTDFT